MTNETESTSNLDPTERRHRELIQALSDIGRDLQTVTVALHDIRLEPVDIPTEHRDVYINQTLSEICFAAYRHDGSGATISEVLHSASKGQRWLVHDAIQYGLDNGTLERVPGDWTGRKVRPS